jgi:predicted HAD superfamily phosphohydrolase
MKIYLEHRGTSDQEAKVEKLKELILNLYPDATVQELIDPSEIYITLYTHKMAPLAQYLDVPKEIHLRLTLALIDEVS